MSDRRTSGRRRARHHFERPITERLRPLTQLDNWHGPAAFAFDALVIATAISAAHMFPALYPIALFVIGTRQRALATLLHEASHKVLCANRVLNNAIGFVSGWLVFQSFYPYWRSHVQEHHPYLGEARDPDLANYVRQGLFGAEPSSFLLTRLLPIVVGFRIPSAFASLVRDRLIPRNWSIQPLWHKTEFLSFALFWMVAIATCASLNVLPLFLVYWIAPYFFAFLPVNWLIELAEHFPIILRTRDEVDMTRNRLGGPIENFFFGMHGENWHQVHHLRPGIPFWNVEKAHRILLEDPYYAAAQHESGGLFVRGPDGQPSILHALRAQLAEVQAQHLTDALDSGIATRNAA